MASPQSTTADGTTAEARKFEQITFRFCSECSNMLYPKEDADANRLQFTCRTCQYTEPAQSSCVFRNVLNNSQGETAGVTQDVGSDPTVSTTANSIFVPMLVCCTQCGEMTHCLAHEVPVARNGSNDKLDTPSRKNKRSTDDRKRKDFEQYIRSLTLGTSGFGFDWSDIDEDSTPDDWIEHEHDSPSTIDTAGSD